MKKKKIIITIIIVILIITFITIYIININKSRKEMQNNSEIVKTNYEKLTSYVKTYNEIRTKYTNLSSNFFYETYKDKHNEYVSLLTEYNNIIEKIDNSIDNIDIRCNVIYNDKSINSICSNYKVTYEKLINLYINDLTDYNQKLSGYNDYKKDNIEEFNMIHTEYLDYNLDKIYEGKDNNEKE